MRRWGKVGRVQRDQRAAFFPARSRAADCQIDRSHRVLQGGCFERAAVDDRLALGVVSHGEMKSLANLCRIRNLQRVRWQGSFKSDSLILCACPPFLTQFTLVAQLLRESL